ncbi:hypothetical protein EJB05_29715 [Eragrostis curvula]|uniref:non-reducing end alpha-L-arabinofuranosidase n=1 Tax=Eragrostis curvula TaxID=38414 RepID=A0A5J9UTR8_9POAL|nr:hypothetical protein EJB05_29715 [Eragrostis curvula]
MACKPKYHACVIIFFLLFSVSCRSLAAELEGNQTAVVEVDASWRNARKIPETLFGVFFEEINHAGAGGLWAELVSNRGFEAGGPHTPSNIDPWGIIGAKSCINVMTEQASYFKRNNVALRMEVLCDRPAVGIFNPGFWGMNIEEGKMYKLVMYIRSKDSVQLTAKLTCSETSGQLQSLASASTQDIVMSNWTKVELQLLAHGTCRTSRLELKTSKKGVIWLDQVSLMPSDTYKGHGFRKELMHMILELKPRFLRFPGGCFVEGNRLRNAFKWKETVGPWEERPGHYGDVWNYWTDDGLGYYELLQANFEDLGADPVWVVNAGISHTDYTNNTSITPFVKDAIDSLEFAKGSPKSTWGSIRAAMGHPDPFPVKFIAIGNENCRLKQIYQGHYMLFYKAIRGAYPDIQFISNCDGLNGQLDHPADFYDVHIYGNATELFVKKDMFYTASRTGPKAFVSEYAARNGKSATLFASLAEAAFLITLERNSDVVQMASYAPLFVNDNDRNWLPDAIVFNSWQQYGTPSYWVQTFFSESSGSVLHPITIRSSYSGSLASSAITWRDTEKSFLRVKVVNFGPHVVNLTVAVNGLQAGVNTTKSAVSILSSSNAMNENSFSSPNNVVPVTRALPHAGKEMQVLLAPYSLTSFDLALEL